MSQKSSLPQAAKSVSQVLVSDSMHRLLRLHYGAGNVTLDDVGPLSGT